MSATYIHFKIARHIYNLGGPLVGSAFRQNWPSVPEPSLQVRRFLNSKMRKMGHGIFESSVSKFSMAERRPKDPTPPHFGYMTHDHSCLTAIVWQLCTQFTPSPPPPYQYVKAMPVLYTTFSWYPITAGFI